MVPVADQVSRPAVIILGASAYPAHGDAGANMASPKFAASADALQRYAMDYDGLGLPGTQILNLFDFETKSSDQVSEIEAFFGRIEQPTHIIFYYTGHGHFVRMGKYVLVLRSSRPASETTGLQVGDLLAVVPEKWASVIRCFFIDACFAGGAAMDAGQAILEGCAGPTVLLCSSGTDRKSYLSDDWGARPVLTPFTEVLLHALTQSGPSAGPWMSAADIHGLMRGYITARNDTLAAGRTAPAFASTLATAPDPKLAGGREARLKPLFPNFASATDRREPPEECKGAQWMVGQWAGSHIQDPSEGPDLAWGFFIQTEDQFEPFLRGLKDGWKERVVAAAAALPEGNLSIYELLGGHELLILFNAKRDGAEAVRDYLIDLSDHSDTVRSRLQLSPRFQDRPWAAWRDRNNVTAFCFPRQKSRGLKDGKWLLKDGRLRRTRSEVFQSGRTIKAFVALRPKDRDIDTASESDFLQKIIDVANRYTDIVERVYHHAPGRAAPCSLDEYPCDSSDRKGFSLRFQHLSRHAMLFEILIPCGKFSRLNTLSSDLLDTGLLGDFSKSTYIAYCTHFPAVRAVPAQQDVA